MNYHYFMTKIPNIRVMREFWVRKGLYYCPSLNDMTNTFVRKVLSGKKKLMKANLILWVEEVPRWKNFSSKVIWGKAK